MWAEGGKLQGRGGGTVTEGERAVGRLLFRSYGYRGGTQPVLMALKRGARVTIPQMVLVQSNNWRQKNEPHNLHKHELKCIMSMYLKQ